MKNITICDDDPAQLEMMSEIVSDVVGPSAFIWSFSSPLEMIHDILDEKNVPDLLIIDFCMPELDGVKALRILRGHGVESKAIFVSGFIDKIERQLVPSNNIVAVVDKAFGYKEFASKIREAFDLCQEPAFVLEKESGHDHDTKVDTKFFRALA